MHCFLIKLQIRIRRIGKDAQEAEMRSFAQRVSQVENHRLRAVHPAATDDLQDLHLEPLFRCQRLVRFGSRQSTVCYTASLQRSISRLPSSGIASAISSAPCSLAEADAVTTPV